MKDLDCDNAWCASRLLQPLLSRCPQPPARRRRRTSSNPGGGATYTERALRRRRDFVEGRVRRLAGPRDSHKGQVREPRGPAPSRSRAAGPAAPGGFLWPRSASATTGASPRGGRPTRPAATSCVRCRPRRRAPAARREARRRAVKRVTVYRSVTSTWYGPGFYGQRTACGQRLTTQHARRRAQDAALRHEGRAEGERPLARRAGDRPRPVRARRHV